jgi:hypothetical protein
MSSCVRLGESTTILVIYMKMKPHFKSLGHNPLSDVSYRNSGMMLNEQGSSHHSLGGTPYLDLDTVLSEQGLCHHILNDVLHHRLDIVKNEQESSHLTRCM